MRVDGANQEWQDAAILVDKTSKAEYALRNDDKYLYILFLFKVVKGVPVLSTYEMSGMKVFFSLDAKKHKEVGFHFVKKTVTADELIASLEKAGETLTDEKKAGIRLQKSYMIFEGVPLDAKSPAPVVPAGPADPPTFRDSIKRDLSVVEFRIPLVYLAQAGAAHVAWLAPPAPKRKVDDHEETYFGSSPLDGEHVTDQGVHGLVGREPTAKAGRPKRVNEIAHRIVNVDIRQPAAHPFNGGNAMQLVVRGTVGNRGVPWTRPPMTDVGLALGLQMRFRHMSNAGMASSNPGVNTFYGLLGLTFH